MSLFHHFQNLIDYHFQDERKLEIAMTVPGALGDKKGNLREKMQYEGSRLLRDVGNWTFLLCLRRYAFATNASPAGLDTIVQRLDKRQTFVNRGHLFWLSRMLTLNERQCGFLSSKTIRLTLCAVLGAVWLDSQEDQEQIDAVFQNLFLNEKDVLEQSAEARDRGDTISGTHLPLEVELFSIPSQSMMAYSWSDNQEVSSSVSRLVYEPSSIQHESTSKDVFSPDISRREPEIQETLLQNAKQSGRVVLKKLAILDESALSPSQTQESDTMTLSATSPLSGDRASFEFLATIRDTSSGVRSQEWSTSMMIEESYLPIANRASSLSAASRLSQPGNKELQIRSRDSCRDSPPRPNNLESVPQTLTNASSESTKRKRTSLAALSTSAEACLERYLVLERTRCCDFGVEDPIDSFDQAAKRNSTLSKPGMENLDALRLLFLAIGSPESVVALQKVMQGTERLQVDYYAVNSPGLTLKGRFEILESIDKKLSNLSLQKSYHMLQIFLDCGGASTNISGDGFVHQSRSAGSLSKDGAKGNPINLAKSEISINIVNKLLPGLSVADTKWKTKMAHVNQVRKFGGRLHFMVEKFGYSAIALIPLPYSEAGEGDLHPAHGLLSRITDEVFRAFVYLLDQLRGNSLRQLDMLLGPAIKALVNSQKDELNKLEFLRADLSDMLLHPRVHLDSILSRVLDRQG